MEFVTLNNGIKMPVLGYGVFQLTPEECERCVVDALSTGYRLIDTAQSYYNEESVGNGIIKSGVPREEIFLTTKVWIGNYGKEETKNAVYSSLKKLKTDYLDLCLLHQPFNDVYAAYRALEELYKEGVIRAIGVSNFYADRLVDIASFMEVKPTVNQIEIHPFHQRADVLEWGNKYNVQTEAWAPFGEGKGGMFTNPLLSEIGAKYNKSVAQVILRWHLQRGIVVIPKTTHIDRMKQNIDVFDFTLSAEDMEKIATLETGISSFSSHQDPNKVEWFVQKYHERKNMD